MGFSRINAFDDQTITNLYKKAFARLDRLMRSNGGLTYGWDMPTARVLYPRSYRVLSVYVNESKRRNK